MKVVMQSGLLLLVVSVISGIIYPGMITGIGQLFFSHKSNGSLIKNGDRVIGSELIAQQFKSPEYFWPRPSASGYSANPSGASNLGPTSKALAQNVANRSDELSLVYGVKADKIPRDLITASASGLDPHISPEAARLQAVRISNERGLGDAGIFEIEKLIDEHLENYQLGILGEKRINVLMINLALDKCCKGRS